MSPYVLSWSGIEEFTSAEPSHIHARSSPVVFIVAVGVQWRSGLE